MERKGTEKHIESVRQMPMWTARSLASRDNVNSRLDDLHLNIYWRLETVSCYGSMAKLGWRLGR